MQKSKTLFDTLLIDVLKSGASNAAVISADGIRTDAVFRDMCESNSCGMYARCWMCPPDIGEISVLMKKILQYNYAVVFNQISLLEDSFDVEGMFKAKKKQQVLLKEVRVILRASGIENYLLLGAGGCGLCDSCAKITDEPCRYPELAISSLEAYGINVSMLAETAGMKYTNGKNTVTYFGTVLFNLN